MVAAAGRRAGHQLVQLVDGVIFNAVAAAADQVGVRLGRVGIVTIVPIAEFQLQYLAELFERYLLT